MKVLVIGSGGREHAITQKISESPRVDKIFVAPGNAGTSQIAENINIRVDDIPMLVAFAQKEAIDWTIVGPELPLVLGIVDAFENEGLKILGPNARAAQFEGSKAFTKAFLKKYEIPTAAYEEYTSLEAAKAGCAHFDYPLVVKADGLAAGKGVVIAQNEAEAFEALDDMMAHKHFGDAGEVVVLEAFLRGYEASILCFVDGETILPMQAAQDHKKAFDGDLGLNTGGMGTYSPSLKIDDAMMARIQTEILNPFITGIKEEGIDFKGILFVGLMIEGDDINVLEYNVRLGDPETEVTLPRLKNDLMDIIEAIDQQRLNEVTLEWSEEHAVCVILASGGYPESYEKGKVITGLDKALNGYVFHCGTKMVDGQVLTNGGRVLGVTALGETLEVARQLAYEDVEKITFEGMFCRTDIGVK